ncbi:Serine/threonine-protein kinase PknD [Chlamydiales bacterium SCGC AB-751-O23]|jgi:eukaryotic-like serine/threonine-protein kinase|nr:Serine/threonine-protein kinase PknD [Chlamydiales bacterium SCGC AB-751-O23]
MNIKSVTLEKKCPICADLNAKTAMFCMSCGFAFQDTLLLNDEKNKKDLYKQTTVNEDALPDSSKALTSCPPLFRLGNYDILKRIGKGGMGEVFLAYEKVCSRLVALKRIKPELKDRKMIYNRFLREAKITSQLPHPAIIPIYALGKEKDFIYYTMPYLEGDTLRDLLKQAREEKGHFHKKEGHKYSIPSLVRYFLPICQAIAYAHSKSVIHRDIKPENIIVGQYGEVLILDWGLAKYIHDKVKDEELEGCEKEDDGANERGMTLPGKVVGTVAYMAPERALGEEACKQTDIYSIGVILYQILTLHFPFKRISLNEFRKTWHQERWTDPSEVAPYREVPKALALISKKCLHPNPEKRYQSVQEVIEDLASYLEGRGQWLEVPSLEIQNKDHWQFQENILIPQEMAITPTPKKVDWVNLMIAKESFQNNTKLEAHVTLHENSKGIGFLIGIPEANVDSFLSDSYCLWMSSENEKTSRLFKSGLEVIDIPEYFMKVDQEYHIRIEKIDQSIQFHLDGKLIFTHQSHMPLVGSYIGLISRDSNFSLPHINVFVSSLSIKVNCLKVPDVLLTFRNYAEALREYRKIAKAFPGRTEGREAMFRAGICLLEKAKNAVSSEQKDKFIQESLDEFSLMHKSPAAPLEYLGKALVYQETTDNEEETKCFELAFRRYSKHPLLYTLKEHLIYRLHQSSKANRLATYRFALLLLQYFDQKKLRSDVLNLVQQLCDHWELLPFLKNHYKLENISKEDHSSLICELGFRLGKPGTILEIMDKEEITNFPNPELINNAIFYLIKIGCYNTALKKIDKVLSLASEKDVQCLRLDFQLSQAILSAHLESLVNGIHSFLNRLPEAITPHSLRCFFHLIELALKKRQCNYVFVLYDALIQFDLNSNDKMRLECLRIWAFMQEGKFNYSQNILDGFSSYETNKSESTLNFLHACQLANNGDEDLAMLHFSNTSDRTNPNSFSLGGYYISSKLQRNKHWHERAFFWEKRALFQQLSLYYTCIKEDEQAKYFSRQEQKQYQSLSD